VKIFRLFQSNFYRLPYKIVFKSCNVWPKHSLGLCGVALETALVAVGVDVAAAHGPVDEGTDAGELGSCRGGGGNRVQRSMAGAFLEERHTTGSKIKQH